MNNHVPANKYAQMRTIRSIIAANQYTLSDKQAMIAIYIATTDATPMSAHEKIRAQMEKIRKAGVDAYLKTQEKGH